MSDIFRDIGRLDRTEYRNMEKIHQPRFEAPADFKRFPSGNEVCSCECHAKYLPRNGLLIRPAQNAGWYFEPRQIYTRLAVMWHQGNLQSLARGSCQKAIPLREIKKLKEVIGHNAQVVCIDNIDNSQLMPGDILLTRHGEKGAGKPHLITKL